ncbi:MAG TPA: hypothetical protein VFI11_00885, partial [Anaerolineales bacterium]|nr:hypothetical protein [Anaerolineales bacterium]
MVDRLRRKVGWVLLAVAAGLITSGLTATAVASPQVEHFQGAKTSKVAYHDEWRRLWEDHITWTRVVILGILNDLPGTPAYVERLLQNYEDMQASLAPYYGDEAQVLGDLVRDHLTIAAELLAAAHDGDTAGFDQARVRWYANAEDLATQMHEMNPRYWSLEEGR